MTFDNELIKDIIIEKEPDIKRESIELYDVFDIDINGKCIIVNYCIMTIKNIHGMEKEFTYCKNLTIKQSDYEQTPYKDVLNSFVVISPFQAP